MYRVENRTISINDEVLEAFTRQVVEGETELLVEAGTTGFQDSDEPLGKHTDEKKEDPTRTILRIKCNEGDFCFRLIKEDDKTVGATIMTCGEEGLMALQKAILFAAKVYRDQCLEIDD